MPPRPSPSGTPCSTASSTVRPRWPTRGYPSALGSGSFREPVLLLCLRRVLCRCGGEPQRINIARAFRSHPAILIFDEPTTGLDPENMALIDRFIFACKDVTRIVITHSWDESYLSRFDFAYRQPGNKVRSRRRHFCMKVQKCRLFLLRGVKSIVMQGKICYSGSGKKAAGAVCRVFKIVNKSMAPVLRRKWRDFTCNGGVSLF